MISDIIKLFDEILKGNQNVWLILSVFLGVWLFRAIRLQVTKVSDMEPARIDKSLEVYGTIEFIIESYENDPETEQKLKKLISSNYTYLSRRFYLQWARYKENKTHEERSILIRILKEEISSLQYNITSKIDIFKNKEASSYFRIIKSLVVAMFVTFICIFIILCYVVLIIYAVDPKVMLQTKVLLGLQLLSFVLFASLLITWFDLTFEKRIRYNFNNTIWLLIMFISFSFVFISYYSILYILLAIYFFLRQFKPMIKTQHEVYIEELNARVNNIENVVKDKQGNQ